jgi:hypothetical protein
LETLYSVERFLTEHPVWSTCSAEIIRLRIWETSVCDNRLDGVNGVRVRVLCLGHGAGVTPGREVVDKVNALSHRIAAVGERGAGHRRMSGEHQASKQGYTDASQQQEAFQIEHLVSFA